MTMKIMSNKSLMVWLSVFCALNIQAAYHEVVQVRSEAMNKDIPVSMVFPDAYKRDDVKRYPVIFMLHGAGGAHMSEVPTAMKLVDQYGVLVVCPDGAVTSWWLDSPIDPTMQYETFVAKELVAHVDKTYRTLAKREKRAITGGSMGGHGACYIAFRHKDLFGAAGNVFGGVDLRPFANSWDIKKRLGTIEENPKRWEENSVITLAKNVKDGELSVMTMIGSKDFFLTVNRQMNQLFQDNGVQHYYIESKGSHTGEYSANDAFPVVFRFLDTYFKEGKGHL